MVCWSRGARELRDPPGSRPATGGAGLAAGLPAMLAGTVRDDLFAAVDEAPADPRLAGHGELPREVRVEVFARTLESVVFPGLEAHGVDASEGRAWLARAQSRLRTPSPGFSLGGRQARGKS